MALTLVRLQGGPLGGQDGRDVDKSPARDAPPQGVAQAVRQGVINRHLPGYGRAGRGWF